MRTSTIIRSAAVLTLGLAIFLSAGPSLAATPAQFGVAVSITVPPPDLPVYDQPPCPGDNYIWVPGYWAWDADEADYYWVPGTWVPAPEPGFLWTPGYWGWNGASFVWNDGYWGPVVGFYGGVDYGFGYFGNGYAGGHWDHDRFYYNREVNNVNVTVVHNVYNERVERFNENRVSYNGGNGGIRVRPTAQQEAAARERHVAPVSAQRQQMQDARSNRELWSSVNHGRPPIAATPKPAEFRGNNVVAAREAGTVHGNPGANRNAAPGNRVNPGNPANPENRANPGNRPNPENRTYNQPTQPNRGVQPNRNAPEQTPPPNTRENRNNQPQPQAQPQENGRRNEQPSNRERQQEMQQPREQQNQQMRNRPPEQPSAAPREQRPQPQERQQAQPREQAPPRQEQRQQAAPQREARPPAQNAAPQGKEKERNQRNTNKQ